MNRSRSGWMGAAVWGAAMLGSAAAFAGSVSSGLALAGTARSMGMGGAGAAASMDAGAVWLNPANLGWLAAPEAAFMHGQYVADIGVDQLAVAIPVAHGGAAIAAAWTGLGSIESFNAAGVSVGEFSPGDTSLTLAYGYGTKMWAAGAGLGWIRSELASDARATAWSGDAGVSLRPLPMLTVGASVQRAGGTLTYDRESAALPMTIRGGGAVALPMLPVTLAVDGVRTGDEDLSIRGGAEGRHEVKPGLELRVRGGWRTGTPSGGVSGLAAGAAMTWRPATGFIDRELLRMSDDGGQSFWLTAVRVEYAWTPMGDLGQAHWFSLGLLF